MKHERWEAHDFDKSTHIVLNVDGGYELIAIIPHDDVTEEQFEACMERVRLIVSANDLLGALQAIVAADPSPTQMEEWIGWVMQMAKDNIAKATQP